MNFLALKKVPYLYLSSIVQKNRLLLNSQQNLVAAGTSRISSSTDDELHHSNVPFMRRGIPDCSHGFPFQIMKDMIQREIAEKLELERNFKDAVDYWKTYLEKTQDRDAHGLLELISFALINYEGNDLRKNIEKLWLHSQTLLPASDFLAYLVLCLIEAGHPEDAEYFAKKFTIFGTSFIKPLKLMVEKQNDLNFIEQFGKLLENVYYNVPKKPKTKRKANNKQRENTEELSLQGDDQNCSKNGIDEFKELSDGGSDSSGIHPMKEATGIAIPAEGQQEETEKIFDIQTLSWIWAPPPSPNKGKNKKLGKQRWHKDDMRKLDKLAVEFLKIWGARAEKQLDTASWFRSVEFGKRYNLISPAESEELFEYGHTFNPLGSRIPTPQRIKKLLSPPDQQ